MRKKPGGGPDRIVALVHHRAITAATLKPLPELGRGALGCGDGSVAYRCERRAPGNDLVQHGVQCGQVVVAWLEHAEVLELGHQRQGHLLADVGHLQFPGDEPEVFGSSGPAGAAVGDEADCLVVPLGVQVVDGVFQDAGGAVVVLGCHDDEAVKRGDLRRPLPGVLVLVLAERGRQRFVQVRERVVAQVEEFEVGVAATRRSLQHPVGDLLAVAVGAGAAQDDPDPAHGALPCRIVATSSKIMLKLLRQASTVDSMARAGRGPAVVALSAWEEAFLRAWSRAALSVPRALDADLQAGQGMSLSEYTALMHLSEAPGRSLRMSDLA